MEALLDAVRLTAYQNNSIRTTEGVDRSWVFLDQIGLESVSHRAQNVGLHLRQFTL